VPEQVTESKRPRSDFGHDVLAVIAAPVMLVMGAPAGWVFLILAAGLFVLLAQWTIVTDITFEDPDPAHIVLCVLGMLCLGLAVVYLSRAANDLPTVFPGYDRHSENFRLIPGLLLLSVGIVAVGVTVARPRPRRAHH